MEKYYDSSYFNWQKKIGEFGGREDLWKFSNYISLSDKVIDFGCGGGYLLKNISCSERIGLEINGSARGQAQQNGIKTVSSIEEIKDEWADIIISNFALEHVENPLVVLKNLYKKLKRGGIIVFVVPQEIKWKYYKDDINQHLYTWSPMSLGNLFVRAGFEVEKVETIKYQWPPVFYMEIRRYFGKTIFNLICKLYSRLQKYIYKMAMFQLRVIAHKK